VYKAHSIFFKGDNMAITTKYVSRDDFRNFSGIDLELELRDKDDTSNKVSIFILQIENWCETYVQYHTGKYYDFTALTPEQLIHWKRGLLYQIEYVIRNGNISNDSGYNPEAGGIVEPNYLNRIALSENAKMEFMMAGIWTRKLRSRYGYKYEDIF
jgi:hypothetical protein